MRIITNKFTKIKPGIKLMPGFKLLKIESKNSPSSPSAMRGRLRQFSIKLKPTPLPGVPGVARRAKSGGGDGN
jgi:hypothetical protein